MAPMTRSQRGKDTQPEGQSLGKQQQQQMKDGGDDQRASVAKTDSISATERLQRASSTREVFHDRLLTGKGDMFFYPNIMLT
ncbi:hypothetical protein OsI_05710 [Oryza sativa Indica Group]|uniref:Uncharacterized protein n=2 Tax=Oryza sativa TaxID=4530 RepID=B9F296_ORYSJ|nr:hypothetical protein OsI_05710 [Oryza sativa Indica Group]EEE56236.1 hypothetical protein OsJ_05237 [Oryza sativa Japonica Group]